MTFLLNAVNAINALRILSKSNFLYLEQKKKRQFCSFWHSPLFSWQNWKKPVLGRKTKSVFLRICQLIWPVRTPSSILVWRDKSICSREALGWLQSVKGSESGSEACKAVTCQNRNGWARSLYLREQSLTFKLDPCCVCFKQLLLVGLNIHSCFLSFQRYIYIFFLLS